MARAPGLRNTKQTATLTYNDAGKFEDRWTYLKLSGHSVWTEGVKELVYIPVAHAEGKFVPEDKILLNHLKTNGQIIFVTVIQKGPRRGYPGNPNGSVDDIAGITDRTGRILGLMPHPERHFFFTQHPFWTRLDKKNKYGEGAKIFENGINYIKRELIAKAR